MSEPRAALDAAIRAGCETVHDDYPCIFPRCVGRCYARGIGPAAIRAFIENPDISISAECRETLRAHLEGDGVPIRTCPRTKNPCYDARCARDWCRREEHYP